MNSVELYRALAHNVIDGDYGGYTIDTSSIRIQLESGFTLFINAFDGDQLMITTTFMELEGKKGYHESDVDELKKLVSEATPKIDPVKIFLSREGCDAICFMKLLATCKHEEDVPGTLAESVHAMEDAVNTVFSIYTESKKREEADLPF